jgi:putative transposase
VFADDEDYQYYLNNLFEWVKLLKCKLYGFCLMTNHVHLLIDPGDETMSLGKLMKRVAGRQTAYTNKLEKRTGSLWEGRFRSSPEPCR